MTVPFYVSTPGLASPSVLQSPAAPKPKNGSVAISKPQEGQPHFSVHYIHRYIEIERYR